MEDAIYGSWVGRLVYRVRHLLNRNSKANSRKNIHAHYDLGNAFYELWLDGTMNYSSALFEAPDQPMVDAQHAKVRRAIKEGLFKPGLLVGGGVDALYDAALAAAVISRDDYAVIKRRGELRDKVIRVDDFPYDFDLREAVADIAEPRKQAA